MTLTRGTPCIWWRLQTVQLGWTESDLCSRTVGRAESLATCYGFLTDNREQILQSPAHQNRLWDPHHLFFNWNRGSFHRDKAARTLNWITTLVSSFKISGAILTLALYAFMKWAGTLPVTHSLILQWSFEWFRVLPLTCRFGKKNCVSVLLMHEKYSIIGKLWLYFNCLTLNILLKL